MSDLPPGITQDMIPGNRPEDLVWDRFYDWLNDYADAHGLGPDQIQARIDICGKTRQGGGSSLRCHRRTDHPGPCHFRPTDADTGAVGADEVGRLHARVTELEGLATEARDYIRHLAGCAEASSMSGVCTCGARRASDRIRRALNIYRKTP